MYSFLHSSRTRLPIGLFLHHFPIWRKSLLFYHLARLQLLYINKKCFFWCSFTPFTGTYKQENKENKNTRASCHQYLQKYFHNRLHCDYRKQHGVLLSAQVTAQVLEQAVHVSWCSLQFWCCQEIHDLVIVIIIITYFCLTKSSSDAMIP